jgi:hypothetical protein
MDWEIVLLDEVSNEEGAKWERYYYDELMPLYNYQVPGQTKEEYNRTEHEKERCRIKSRNYRARKKNAPDVLSGKSYSES